jgi:hypothetical protein
MVAAPFDVRAYLDEPGRTAQVASVSAGGTPLLGSLWFAFADGRFWFSSLDGSPLPDAASAGRPVAVIVDEFNPPESIRQVRIRGRGRIERHNAEAVRRIYRRYLGTAIAAGRIEIRSTRRRVVALRSCVAAARGPGPRCRWVCR